MGQARSGPLHPDDDDDDIGTSLIQKKMVCFTRSIPRYYHKIVERVYLTDLACVYFYLQQAIN